MNTITIELCAEDRARLDNILAALQSSGTPFSAPVKAPEAVEPEKEGTPPAKEEEPAQAETAAKPVDVSLIQKKVLDLSASGKRDQAREIIKSYADKISAIPKEKTAEVWEKLTALEG